jgi:predicted AAA+ superfamily ATPase
MKIDYFIRKQELNLLNITTKFIRSDYLSVLQSAEKLIGIVGPRGVGKTTLLFQYIKLSDEKALYMSGDDIEFTNSKIYELVDEFYTLGGRLVVIDEVHKYRNWAQEIKNIYDTFPDIKIRISGSSMLNILYEKYDLSRRLVIHHMGTLSFKEYLELTKNIQLQNYTLEEILTHSSSISKELVFEHKDLYANFKEYLKFGAYPFFLEGIDSFNNKLYNALDKIIYEDIPSLNKIDYSHITIFEKLIYFVVSANTPFNVNVAALAREFGITEPTLNTYLQILDKTGIFKSMRKQSKRISKKPQKLLFSNTNIAYAYADKINLDLEIGVVRETFFVNCFKDIYYSDIGDFVVDGNIFEVGGKNKTFSQIKDVENSFLAIDIDFTSNAKKVPLWLFSFLK